MRNENGGAGYCSRKMIGALLDSDSPTSSCAEMDVYKQQESSGDSLTRMSGDILGYYDNSPSPARSGDGSPYPMSPWDQLSPYTKSPWIVPPGLTYFDDNLSRNGLIGSLVREDGHVYSLAVAGDSLYTGSDSYNIRVWKKLKEFTGFKSNSGLVKAIVVCGDKIFTGHQDGKIRVWKLSPSPKNSTNHKRIGSLPSFKDSIKNSMIPKNYVQASRHRTVLRIKHFDAVSCMSLNKEQGLLYSGSWDKSVKVWLIANWEFLESIAAHEDAVNSVASGFDGFLFTGSADGTVKAWRRELHGRTTKHFLVRVLLKQESAVTALAVNRSSAVVYGGSSDGLVTFWEGEKLFSNGGTLRGHKLAVLCLSTAGSLVFSGSADKNICVWKREEGNGSHTCLSVFTGHTGPVKCLAVDEDEWQETAGEKEARIGGRRWVVYSGSLDKSVKVWRMSEEAPELGRPSFLSSPLLVARTSCEQSPINANV